MDPITYRFYAQDRDVYSWLVTYEVSNFEARVEVVEQDVVAALPAIKYNLDEKKNQVKQSTSRVECPA